MNSTLKKRYFLFLVAVLAVCAAFVRQQKPTLYLIGDSTMNNNTRTLVGWGNVAATVFDTTKVNLKNAAMAGRSTRTFVKEGRWAKVIEAIKPGDYLIMAFGHNEGARPDTSKNGYRGVFRGIGPDSVALTWKDGSIEVVHSYGWYLEKFTREAKAKGATVIISSMIPRSDFKMGTDSIDRVVRNDKDYALWAKQVADKTGAYFVDLNKITADKYDKIGRVETKKFFPEEHTHTNIMGATINAQSIAEGIRMQPKIGLNAYIKAYQPFQFTTSKN